jgi:HEAT repeat protein
MLTILLTTSLFMAPQEPSLVSGSYRGPVDEAQMEMLNFGSGAVSPFGHTLSTPDSAWDRWEFWYENERDTMIRGAADFPANAVNEFGFYGANNFNVKRDEFLLKSIPLLLEATLSDDAAVRESALLSLGRVAYPATTPFIIESLADKEQSVRQAAYIALGLMSTVDATDVLIDTFNNSRGYNAKCFAAVGLGLSGRNDAGDCLNNFFNLMAQKSSWRKVDNLLIASLLAAKTNTSVDYSENLLAMTTVMDKRRASDDMQVATINALAATSNMKAIEVLVNNIDSRSAVVAESCITALGRFGSKVATPGLIQAFEETNNPRIQGLIQLSLGQIADPKAAAFLLANRPRVSNELFVHTSWIIACGIAKLPEAYTQVADTVLFGSDFNEHDDADASRNDEYELRGAAALSLGLYAKPAARLTLSKCLQETNVSEELSSYIATALGMLGTDKAANVLLENADQFNYSATSRRGFATALGMCTNEKANERLAEMLLSDDDATVRWISAHAMAGTRDQQSLEQLTSALSDDINAGVVSERTAHLVLGLGYLGDVHRGATLEAIAANVDHRQQNDMLTCLKSY